MKKAQGYNGGSAIFVNGKKLALQVNVVDVFDVYVINIVVHRLDRIVQKMPLSSRCKSMQKNMT
jgi:hypothetical protein